MTQEWINILDQQPEYMQVCNVYTAFGCVTTAQYSGDANIFGFGDERFECTHWMEMPLPPSTKQLSSPKSRLIMEGKEKTHPDFIKAATQQETTPQRQQP